MNIIFMGTPDFAVPSLKALISEYGVQAVFTQPDKPKGRGKKVTVSAVKEVALENNITVYQPVKLKGNKEMLNIIKEMNPDFIVVVAFGQILLKELLEIPKYGCINLHASLLPKYRGAAPINWSIIDGETKTGNTTMLMDEGIDTGDILLKDEVTISDNMTAGELHDILMERGAELLIKTIKGINDGSIKPMKQGEAQSNYASMLNKEMGKINWNNSAENIHNLIRGLNPWPLAYTSYKGDTMKIYESKVIKKHHDNIPGTILSVGKDGIEIAASKDAILIKKIQFPNSKALLVEQYINGHNIEEGTILI